MPMPQHMIDAYSSALNAAVSPAFEFSHQVEIQIDRGSHYRADMMANQKLGLGTGLYRTYGPSLELEGTSWRDVNKLQEVGEELTSGGARATILMMTGRRVNSWDVVPWSQTLCLVLRGITEEAPQPVDWMSPSTGWLAAYEFVEQKALSLGLLCRPFIKTVADEMIRKQTEAQRHRQQLQDMFRNVGQVQGLYDPKQGAQGIAQQFPREWVYGTSLPEQMERAQNRLAGQLQADVAGLANSLSQARPEQPKPGLFAKLFK